jgi:hypothetical protein
MLPNATQEASHGLVGVEQGLIGKLVEFERALQASGGIKEAREVMAAMKECVELIKEVRAVM